MNSFRYYNPVRVYFGENAVSKLKRELPKYGEKVLLTYGGGSIKRNGIYDAVRQTLLEAGKKVFELSGIMPNPRTEKVYEGIKICKRERIDLILAVGGGSVIDCAKAIAIGSKAEKDFWEAFYVKHEKPTDALPFGVVLTVAATGSERDNIAVITNWADNAKVAYGHELMYAQFAILDPTYTYSLPKEQLICGSVDILSHVFEVYFSRDDKNNVSDDLAEAIMKNIIVNLNVALENPHDYVARSNLMWDSSLAISGLLSLGKETDWQAHEIEHAMSALFDIAHGAGLAVVHPNYLKYIYKKAPEKFARYAVNIWHISPAGKTTEKLALEGIEATGQYFREIGAPTTLGEVGIQEADIDQIAEKTLLVRGSYAQMTALDIKKILKMCL